jgi:hypothetical protein
MTVDQEPSVATTAASPGAQHVLAYPLLDAMARRRSRRFALGDRLQAGALSFTSAAPPVPLGIEEEAVLAFAGAGVTGRVNGELPYTPDAGPETGGGQVMVTMLGRTFASADAAATSALFITRDDGTFLMRRPQDFPREEFDEIAGLGRAHRFVELYERSRVRISDRRAEIRREVPFTPPFNKWSTNVPGSTYFVPVTEVTALYLTILFAVMGDEFAYFFHDDRDWLVRPAGTGRWARSKGGHLHDDVKDGRVGTIDEIETYLLELCAFEQGLMVQNIALATEALGLGGFPHYGAHRFAWPEAFGLRLGQRTFAQILHKGPLGTLLVKLLGKNVSIPQALGFEHDGTAYIKPYAPPWYPSMEAAVRAFVASKFAAGTGTFRDAPGPSPWRDPAAIQATIPEYSERDIKAVIAHCQYVFDHYGQFPGNYGPIRTVMAYQAHHIDTSFYDRLYKDGVYTDEHRQHFARWHPEPSGTDQGGVSPTMNRS